MTDARDIQCTEVWGGTTGCDVSVSLAGMRGEVFARPHGGGAHGGDIHYLSVCGMAILSKAVLADVSGHGAESADVSRVIHDALAESIGAHDNSSMLQRVNEAFLARHRGDFRFTTMVSLIFDSRDRSLVYAYAGHPAILRGEAATGRFGRLLPARGPRGGMPLGILPGTSYTQHHVLLQPGDVLVLYSDAFTDLRDPATGDVIGEKGLAALLEGLGTMRPDRLKAGLLDAVGARLDDDATLVVLEVL